MTTYQDLKNFFASQDFSVIIAADAETRRSIKKKDAVVTQIPAGGVGVALDPIALASHATYIGRAKDESEKVDLDKNGKLLIHDDDSSYQLKRIFISDEDLENYYYGFSNQTLWPLSHVAFEKPLFKTEWFEGYKKVNQQFADAISREIKGKTFIWIHDYQLSLVPSLLGKRKDVVIGMFWHIPWPTWEVFRILPWKKEILESMLACDYLAFHRGYQARNFIDTIDREFETRVDQERSRIHYKNHSTTVDNLPLGIDVDVIKEQVHDGEDNSFLTKLIREMIGISETDSSPHPLDAYFEKHQVILGVDRLDYTKGLSYRLMAIDRFFEKYKEYIGKAIYLGIIAPSREAIPSYKSVKKEVKELEKMINDKYAKDSWKPIHLIHDVFPREEVLNFYKKADICLVTPLDDGMNLVSKEFIVASSVSDNPGMLVLSQFAGSAIDLTEALIVNPYSIDEVADAIHKGLSMDKKERIRRTEHMTRTLEERNVYEWAELFFKRALLSLR